MTPHASSASELSSSLSRHLQQTLREVGEKLDESSAQGALARGKVFQIAGYPSDAERSYSEALALDPELDEAAVRLAIVQLASGDPAKALKTATAAAAHNLSFAFKEVSSEQHVSVLTVLGETLVANGRQPDAIEAYKLARSTVPNDSLAACRLAQLYMSSGAGPQALEYSSDVAANPRFRGVAAVLALGLGNVALLPTLMGGHGCNLQMPGRPFFVEGKPQFASLVENDASWCANIPD